MKYSIILPCYNISAYIETCLNSIFRNDTTSCEIILINDGSADNTLEIIKKYFKINGGGRHSLQPISQRRYKFIRKIIQVYQKLEIKVLN